MTTTTDHALRVLTEAPKDKCGTHGRAAFLALALLTERDLSSPNGCDVIRPDRVAALTGLATSTTDRTLRALAATGALVRVTQFAGVRHANTGPEVNKIVRGSRLLGYRLPEGAFQ